MDWLSIHAKTPSHSLTKDQAGTSVSRSRRLGRYHKRRITTAVLIENEIWWIIDNPRSRKDQNLELQSEALRKAGCRKIFEDRASGSWAERLGLAQARESLRAGDTLVVWKLDRLGRSVKSLVDLVGELHTEGVQFRSLTDSIDTGTPSGRFFFHVMANLAEMERELIVERTRAGLEVARQLGRIGGRTRLMTESKVKAAKKLLASGVSARDVAGNLGISVPTLYRWLPASTHG